MANKFHFKSHLQAAEDCSQSAGEGQVSARGKTVLWLITGAGIQGWSSSIWARYLSPSEITSTDPWGPDVLCSLRMTNSVVQYDLGMGLLVNDML